MKLVNGLWFPDRDELFSKLHAAGKEWEPENIDAAITACTKRSLAIDCGAHIGLYTRRLADHFTKVIAFEPVHHEPLMLNTQGMNVEIISCGVSDQAESVAFSDTLPNSGVNHVRAQGNTLCITIDSLNLTPDLIKMDVEGYELKALRGAEQTLKRCKPVLLVESNGHIERYGSKEKDLKSYLGSLGYVMARAISEDLLFV